MTEAMAARSGRAYARDVFVVDCSKALDRASLHDELERSLPLPSYYGRNLDALYDSLCELHGCEIIVAHTDALSVLGSYGERLLECLEDVYEDTGLDIRFIAD
ncbi:MAG: barstar family protein [Atopobiaceae bacterium]|nr:barstar family protein [Atopobiaceae bacterium]